MALNPNIILSGMPQPFDTNALLQQQISGMENINALERQRRADELAMQDRAAAAEKEAAQAQEAATLKALLPAYTYGIQTGDIAGAGQLVPPEMRPQIQQYIDALTGKSPQEVQAALIGSLSSSPMGQEALGAIQRAQTAQIQLGQLDVSRGRLAFDTEQAAAAAAAAGQPKPMTEYEAERIRLDREKAEREAAMPEGMTAKTKVKFDEAYPKSSSALRTAVTGMDNTLIALKELIDSPGLKAISGVVGAYTPDITPEARRAAALFNQIKAGAGLAALTELKQASPTGGALGNVSNQEGNTLRDSRGAFLQTQNYEDLRDALIDYYGVLERSKANIVGAFNDTYSYRGENAAEEILGPMRQSQEQIEQDIQRQFPPAPQTPPPSGGFRILNVR